MKRKLCITVIISFLAVLFISVTFFTAGAVTTSGYYNGYYYTVSGGEATIEEVSSVGAHAIIPSKIGNYPVTKIKAFTFEYCTQITNVTIPDSVTDIGEGAFHGCTEIKKMTLPLITNLGYLFRPSSPRKDDNLYVPTSLKEVVITGVTSISEAAFSECSGLTSVIIPDSVTTIGYNAFSNCTNLSDVTFGNGINNIGAQAFYKCTKLKNVNIPDLQVWCNISFSDSYSNPLCYSGVLYAEDTAITQLVIPEDVKSVGNYVFAGCYSLKSVTIPDTVTNIGCYAFADCTNLTNVTISNGVKSINGGAFKDCTKLTDVIIPGSVKSIEYSAFEGCSGLTSVTIGRGVTSIGEHAFYDCYRLKSITIPNGVVNIGNGAFRYCSSLTDVTVSGSVTSIGNEAFAGCSQLQKVKISSIEEWCKIKFSDLYANPLYYAGLLYVNDTLITELVIPDGVKVINSYAFYGCSDLIKLTISNSVESIGSSAFYGCDGLVRVTIGGNVEYIGEGAFSNCSGLVAINYNAINCTEMGNSNGVPVFSGCISLSEISIGESVTHIPSYAFKDCSNVSYIEFPDSVINIGTGAFRGCDKLLEIIIPENVTTVEYKAFEGCTSLKKITLPFVGNSLNSTTNAHLGFIFGGHIPASLKEVVITNAITIGDEAFCNCTELEKIIIPDSVTSIGSSAFESCSELLEITIPDSVTSIGNRAFYNCIELRNVTIGNGVRYIGEDTFNGCCKLTSVALGNSVSAIENKAFYTCVMLAEITIPDSVTRIGNSAFTGCSALSSVAIPDNVTSIGSSAFTGCTSLKSVTLGDRLEHIGSFAFSSCYNLKDITIPISVTYIDDYAFYECYGIDTVNFSAANCTKINNVYENNHSVFSDCPSLKTVNISKTVENIPEHAFAGCIGITNITIPDSVKSIGDSAFSECGSLESVAISNSVTNIGKEAFYICYSLNNITIGGSVKNIGESAFGYCEELKTVYFLGDETQWQKISVDNYNKYLTDASICFNSCVGNAMHTCDEICQRCGKVRSVPHTYSGDCDEECNACYVKRTPLIPHSYDNMCDTECNLCGITRQTIHSYSGDCDAECNVCKTIRNVSVLHTYTSECDTKCNLCGNIRTVKHFYSSECDSECNKCKEKRVTSASHTYYNSCDTDCNLCSEIRTITHSYKNACDITCDICGQIRTVPDHNYTLNSNHTCDICKYSRTPSKPIIERKTNNSVALVRIEGFEYSKDGLNWQTANVFTNLSADTTYKFYQRVKASSNALVSEISEGLAVTFKSVQTAPYAPIISSFTDTMVTLVAITNGEYSTDGANWQASNVFTGLSSGTKYTFYQRYAETDTHESSNISTGTSVTTDKSKQTLIPNTPTVQSFTASSITLTPIDGCEYSKNGTTWQTNNTFYNLSCGTEYTFYQRYKETATTYAGKSSSALKAQTDKGTQTKPSAPTLSSKTYNSVTLTAISGYEYSRDGINWQSSNVFTGLTAETNYLFYRRRAETNTHYASESSAPITVKTDDAPICVIDPTLHIYDNDCDKTCNLCGSVRNVQEHKYSNTCDATCNECQEVRVVGPHKYDNACDESCNTCGATRSIAHDYTEATCRAPKTCKICGTTSGNKLSHNADAGTITQNATCTATGTMIYKCTLCNEVIKTDAIAMLTHDYDSGKLTKSATCKETGIKTYTCSVCKGTKTETIAKSTTHSYSNNCDSSCNVCGATRSITHNYATATCTKSKTCKVCGATSGKALGHTHTNSCDKSCNRCKATRSIKHTYTNACDTTCNICKATRSIKHSYKTTTTKATLKKNGSVVKKCTVCGIVASKTTIKYVKSIKLSATSYTYNGKVKTPTVTVKDSSGKTLKKNTDYTVSYAKGRKKVGTYKVTIKFKGNYSGTKTLTFKINPAKTNVSKLTAGKKSITVNITKKSTQVTGYQIQYSTSKKFTKAKTKTITSYKTTKYTLKGLSAKKTYYVRVRTYKTVGNVKYYSGWSTYKYVKTK